MPLGFDQARWDRIKRNYGAWWRGELDRPLIYVGLTGIHPGRPEPRLPSRKFTAAYGLSVPVEAIVDRWDYNLSCARFVGDGFPSVFPSFGPGVAAAFLGADLACDSNTVWFHPRQVPEISKLHLAYDPDNAWFRRVKELSRAAVERWGGRVQVGICDLGGCLDILATFRTSEHLLTDLYDYPDEVRRLTWQIHDLWWRYYREIDAVLKPLNPGYTTWTQIFSADPYYMLQCDFAYMIGPEMFDDFVKPELSASCRKLTNPFYHLDGIGQLPHLDSLLAIPELKGVQWIPGAGQPPPEEWPDVLRKIRGSGKRLQTWGDAKVLEKMVASAGSEKGVIIFHTAPVSEEKAVMRFLERYGVEP